MKNPALTRRLCRLYRSGLSLAGVARETGMSPGGVYRRIIAGGAGRTPKQAAAVMDARGGRVCNPCRGSKHWKWAGGRRVKDNGYVVVWKPGHPRAIGGRCYVYEHILVAERKLGRPMRRDEVAHHINGKKTDNRPSNIQVMTRAAHVRHHKPRLGYRKSA